VDLDAPARRYDATPGTLCRVAGGARVSPDHDDEGRALPPGVAAGILADCSGTLTPWGTVLSAEENAQDFYGDLEACWSAANAFLPGTGFDPGAPVAPVLTPETAISSFGRSVDPRRRHARDLHGYLVDMDPGRPPSAWYGRDGPGRGHRKLGAVGRARWENATFAVDRLGGLVPGRPVVLYAGDDRKGGRLYRFTSARPFERGMARWDARALLDDGVVHVAHFEDLDARTGLTLATGGVPTSRRPGRGRWIRLSPASDDPAPNAPRLGPGTSVGAALHDAGWNGIGSFPNEGAVLRSLHTASTKVGVRELNRPEDVEWNPNDPSGRPRLYVAFTGFAGTTATDADGVVGGALARDDRLGAIFALDEDDAGAPDASSGFSFHAVWLGSRGTGPFDAACPDNLLVDRWGGVWFGTDGNPAVNGAPDALYWLEVPPLGIDDAPDPPARAWRIATVPGGAEATGPCLTPDGRTLFLSVQHPGEDLAQPSPWPGSP
jgi:secreted PhoX family phosphatase